MGYIPSETTTINKPDNRAQTTATMTTKLPPFSHLLLKYLVTDITNTKINVGSLYGPVVLQLPLESLP